LALLGNPVQPQPTRARQTGATQRNEFELEPSIVRTFAP
jgi:hypothetical protein